jgi:hypothetical protein
MRDFVVKAIKNHLKDIFIDALKISLFLCTGVFAFIMITSPVKTKRAKVLPNTKYDVLYTEETMQKIKMKSYSKGYNAGFSDVRFHANNKGCNI